MVKNANDATSDIGLFLENSLKSPYLTVKIQDQNACSVQSDLDLHCPQKFREPRLAAKGLKK